MLLKSAKIKASEEVLFMKRIKSACLLQTICFQFRAGAESSDPAGDVRREYESYKTQLQRSGTRFQVVSEEVQPDGSIVVSIKKQYNSYDTGDYMSE
jgi:hypothetical protein